MIRAMGRNKARLGALAACSLLTLSACVSRPEGTDLFGRPLNRADSSSETTLPAERRTVSDGAPDDLLAGIELRPPSAAPAWSPSPVATDARQVAERDYVVRAGDTLRGIGNRTGAGSEAIARANTMAAPYAVRVGQSLHIPGGRYHEVLSGQTGIAIARAYGVDWNQVVADNALAPPFVLRVGQRLRLPPGPTPARPLTVEEQVRAFTLDIDDIVTGGTPAAPPSAVPARPPATAPTRFAWPMDGALLRRFGPASGGRINEGIDIAAPTGTPVRASADGIIAYAGSEIGLFGGLILIDHGGGWISAYGHLDRVAVASGTRVRSGAIIATSGDSGQVEQPQLHFELRQNRRPVDPLRHLPAR
jgi:murein DD-endopeptidase MepM/ murein hydrolase activator NlpD